MKTRVIAAICMCLAAGFITTAIVLLLNSKTFVVSFDTDGGSFVPMQTVKKGEKVSKPSDPIKKDYSFVRWEYQNKEYDFTSKVESDLILKAIWKENETLKYKITFNVDGNIKTIEVSKASDIDVSNLGFEEKSGYVLKWYLNNQEYDFGTILTGDITLIGKFEKVVSYTVKFDSDGGTKVADQTVNDGEKAKEPKNVIKYGYVLDGWYYDNKKYDFNNLVITNMLLVAKWNEDPSVKRFTITFDSNGGSVIASQRVMENQNAQKPSNPKKNGFTFEGWYLNNKEYNFNTKITSNITLVAKWKELAKYTVTFNSDGGSSVASQTIYEGEKANKPSDPTREGYKFDGWQLDGNNYDFNTIITKNITLIALWNELPSQDKQNITKMISNIENANLVAETGNANLISQITSVSGCSISINGFSTPIERDINDKTVSITINISCGSENSSKTKIVTIPKSPYTYSKTMNNNMLNYDVTVNGGSWLGDGKLFLGTSGGFNVINRKAVVEISKIEDNPTFKMRFNSDNSTIYIVSFK